MISAKTLVQMAKRWQRIAALALAKEIEGLNGPSTSVAGKGYRDVYSVDRKRFEVPLVYLGTTVFGELLRQSQEEFGFSSDDGRIMLPCDATVMEYIMCLLRRDASEEIERVLLSSIVRPCNYGNNAFVQSMGSRQVVASKLVFLASEDSDQPLC